MTNDDLRTAAEAATPGPWEATGGELVASSLRSRIVTMTTHYTDRWHPDLPILGDVLRTLDERDALLDRVAELEKALDAAEYGLDLAIEQRSDWLEEAQEALNTVRAALRKDR
jgi:hypothetical protein